MVAEPEVSPEATAALTQKESELEIGLLLTIDRNRTNLNLLPLRRKE